MIDNVGAAKRAPRGEVRTGRLKPAFFAFALLPLSLCSCSAFLFDDEQLEPQRITTIPPPSEEEAYPNLGSVPQQAPLPSSSAKRQEVAGGLAADRGNARYTEEALVAEQAATPMPRQPQPLEYTPMTSGGTQGMGQTPSPSSAPPPPDLGGAPPPPQAAALAPPPPGPPQPPQQPVFAAPAPAPAPAPAQQAFAQPPPVPAPPQQAYAQPPPAPAPQGSATLLQQQAYQQQMAEGQRLQQLAMEQQAFEQQARRQAIEQQYLRDQMIQQQQWQRQTMQLQARQQLAGLPPQPAPMPPAMPPPMAAGMPTTGATAAPVAGPSPVNGQLVALIYFGHGSTELDANDRNVLREVVALQQRAGGRAMAVVGHSSSRTRIVDPVKHQTFNLDVSMKRAKRVVEALVGLGVDRSQLLVEARSDAQPVFHEFMPTGEAGNRRVEIFLQ